ncbi:MAG TPA: uroporphyrinogen-III synthase [Puia sp.]|nr:uroporphyrinogen-III synthase [Puia sp.]
MSERRVTILSTASLPLERIKNIPGTVDIQIIPFIEITQRPDAELMPVVSAYGSEKLNVVFTSAHAVKIVSGWLKQKPDWTIYCIRNETRIAVLNWFGSEVTCKFASNALFLSRLMISEGVQKALFFCGDQRLDILPDNLRNNGVELNELIVYDTSLKPVKLKEPPDIILFFSPTAVRSFFSMNKISSGTTVIAMGTTTAAAIKQCTEHPVIISPEADKTYVFNMALDYAASHPIH